MQKRLILVFASCLGCDLGLRGALASPVPFVASTSISTSFRQTGDPSVAELRRAETDPWWITASPTSISETRTATTTRSARSGTSTRSASATATSTAAASKKKKKDAQVYVIFGFMGGIVAIVFVAKWLGFNLAEWYDNVSIQILKVVILPFVAILYGVWLAFKLLSNVVTWGKHYVYRALGLPRRNKPQVDDPGNATSHADNQAGPGNSRGPDDWEERRCSRNSEERRGSRDSEERPPAYDDIEACPPAYTLDPPDHGLQVDLDRLLPFALPLPSLRRPEPYRVVQVRQQVGSDMVEADIADMRYLLFRSPPR